MKLWMKAAVVLSAGGMFLVSPQPAAADPDPCYVIEREVCTPIGEGGQYDDFDRQWLCNIYCSDTANTGFTCMNDNTMRCGGGGSR
jgi:hypothetical protein